MIDFKNVTKNYGKHTAIDGLSLSLGEPKIYCLLGRNGAGKTTFLNLLAGKIAASEGSVTVAGKTVNTLNMPENVRYIETGKVQFNMRVGNLLALAASVDEKFNMDFAMRMIEKFRLDKKKKYKALSFGMKTMVTTIISLASDADIILLDEPVLGFDAIMRKEFYELLSESYAENPRFILVSTHLIDEIADISEQIIMIDEGKLVLNEDINTIVERAYKVTGTKEAVALATSSLNVLETEEIGKFTVSYVFDKRIEADGDIEITDLSLQDLFVKMVGGNANE